jgi:hypothetical protein
MLFSDTESDGSYNKFDTNNSEASADLFIVDKSHTPKTIIIDDNKSLRDIIITIIYVIWLVFFIRDLSTINKSALFTYRSILLLIFLLEVLCNIIKNLRVNYVNHKYEHEIMLKSDYKNKLYNFNNFTKLLDMSLSLIFFANCVLLALEFAPFTNSNCYDYSKGLCTEGRIAAIFGVILAVALLVVFIVGIYTLLNICICRTLSPNMFINRVLNIEIFYDISITRNVIDIFNLATRCPICLTNVGKSEYNVYTTRTKFPNCKHKMHQECIEKMMDSNFIYKPISVCPVCRKPITDINSVSNVDKNVA